MVFDMLKAPRAYGAYPIKHHHICRERTRLDLVLPESLMAPIPDSLQTRMREGVQFEQRMTATAIEILPFVKKFDRFHLCQRLINRHQGDLIATGEQSARKVLRRRDVNG